MKNEKALLVVFAYIVGFTTAFIAFGLTHSGAQVVQRTHVVQAPEVKVQEATVLKAVLRDEGLFIATDQTERIISAHSVTEGGDGPGFHYAIPSYSMSPDKNFVYFCEQQTEVPTKCDAYIFHVAADSTYKVVSEGEHLIINTKHSAVWLSDNRLIVDGYLSLNNKTPWHVAHID